MRFRKVCQQPLYEVELEDWEIVMITDALEEYINKDLGDDGTTFPGPSDLAKDFREFVIHRIQDENRN